MRIWIVVGMLLAPVAGLACNAGMTPVARCVTASGKTAEVCESTSNLSYAYGRVGKPELQLDGGQWNASSGTASGGEQYVFRKGDYLYMLESYSCWRDCEGEDDSMELIVRRGAQEVSRQQCMKFETHPLQHHESSGDWQ